jgi:hypothetical protein
MCVYDRSTSSFDAAAYLRAFNRENARKRRRREKREQKKIKLTAAKRGFSAEHARQKIEEEEEE